MASVDPRMGGPSTAVRALASALTDQGHAVTIVAHDDKSHAVQDDTLPYEILRFPLTMRVWQFSAAYLSWVRKNISRYDAVLVHSLFLSHSFFVPLLARKTKVPYAIRPHGSLNIADMANNLPLKKVYLRAIEQRNLRSARFVFCTSQREADEAVRFGDFRTEVIPLGVDDSIRSGRDLALVDRNLIAFIGRLTRKKGVDIVVRSLPDILKVHPNAKIIVAGPDDEGLLDGFRQLASSLGVIDSISFPGHYGETARNELLAKAGVFILPSLDENFGIGVAEAMAAGVPVAITPGVSHAAYVPQYGAGIVSSRNPEVFATDVSRIIGLDQDAYSSMSHGAERLVQENYSWKRSAAQLVECFAE
ncbi:glycosyltransferase [Arthrobacter sp. Bi83]|uniref:glycosyltransferase n=1 Tax=Arthrobacter sp. Bi83 TaxID=2822353 RepID=UPI001E595FA9|nr:glycosyltransferase [Arthrobacter sp. Bi83]